MRYIVYVMMAGLLVSGGCAPVEKPNKAESHFKMGESYIKAGDMTMALKEILIAESLNPDDAKVHAVLGEVYLSKQAYPEAEAQFKTALRLDQGNPKYQHNLGALYLEMGEYDEAIRNFRLSARNLLYPYPEVSWTGLGYAEFKKENYAEALAAFDQALKANWRFPAAYVNRGEVYYALGEVDKAIIEYNTALEHAPNSIQAHYNLGVAWLKKRETAKALGYFETVVRLDPQGSLSRQAKNFISVLK